MLVWNANYSPHRTLYLALIFVATIAARAQIPAKILVDISQIATVYEQAVNSCYLLTFDIRSYFLREEEEENGLAAAVALVTQQSNSFSQVINLREAYFLMLGDAIQSQICWLNKYCTNLDFASLARMTRVFVVVGSLNKRRNSLSVLLLFLSALIRATS